MKNLTPSVFLVSALLIGEASNAQTKIYDLTKGTSHVSLKTKWGERNWKLTVRQSDFPKFAKKLLVCQCLVLSDQQCIEQYQTLSVPPPNPPISTTRKGPPPPSPPILKTNSAHSFYNAYKYLLDTVGCKIDIHSEIKVREDSKDDKKEENKKQTEKCINVSCDEMEFSLCTSESKGLTFKSGIVEFSLPVK